MFGASSRRADNVDDDVVGLHGDARVREERRNLS
jgi:hypothetical protein